MKVGILGLGVVGNAVFNGFLELGHEISYYDPIKKESKFGDVLDTEICFLCVPTPPNEKGFCDTTIVRQSIERLGENDYSGIIAIKSTVTPGTTRKLSEEYPNLSICFVPEF
jgi:UDP-glucose 6-dehydrogenase